jgi:MFS family permease
MLRRQPRLRRLLAALAVSQAGDWLYNVALLALVLGRTGSPAWAGAVVAARMAPMILGAPFAGAVVDRFDRRRILLASDWARAALMALLALVAAAGLPIVLAPLLAAAATLAGAPYPAAVAASLPRLVDDADLPAANALRATISSAAIVAGPALGALILLAGSPALAFAANGLSFAASALLVATLPAAALSAAATAPAAAARHAFADLRAGAAALLAEPRARAAAGADVACSFLYGAHTVLLGLLAHGGGYGLLIAALGLGGIAGAPMGAKLDRAGLPAALALVALAAALLALAPGTPAALPIALLAGAGALAVEVLADTTLQRSLPPAILGRAYGLYFSLTIAGIAAGSLAAAPLVAALGLHGALLAVACVPALYGAAVALPGISYRVGRLYAR